MGLLRAILELLIGGGMVGAGIGMVIPFRHSHWGGLSWWPVLVPCFISGGLLIALSFLDMEEDLHLELRVPSQ
jgi:hypothetical protein